MSNRVNKKKKENIREFGKFRAVLRQHLIRAIIIHIHFKKTFDIKIRRVLEKAALTCPVYYSLNSSLKKDIQFFWPSEKS